MRTLVMLFVVACSSPSQPPPAQPAPTSQPPPQPSKAPAQTVMTKEECEAKGGFMRADIGGNASAAPCEPGSQYLGPVRFGIEGAYCCK